MKIRPEELETQGYQLLHQIDIHDLKPFITEYMKKKNFYTLIYHILITLLLAALGFIAAQGVIKEDFTWYIFIVYLMLGVGLTFTLIPLHEFIHVLAYKWQGAKQTSYDANWKQFYFMALAHRFVANKKEFRIIAMAPFAFISAVLVTAYFFANPLWEIVFLAMFLIHTLFCGGDFGLMSYMLTQKGKEVVTFDDVPHKTSYFYGKTLNN